MEVKLAAPSPETLRLEEEAYQKAVDARHAAESKLGQVLICTSKGFVSRVQVGSVEVQRKTTRGRLLMRVDRACDEVCTAIVVSSFDTEPEGEAASAEYAGASFT
mmetsp:Transcript_96907/g.207910  ORF Transcript_96907/g.207910 Transcript_96907/m.207910 type:complete len:105 (+) Transcript_96907:3-317(+)